MDLFSGIVQLITLIISGVVSLFSAISFGAFSLWQFMIVLMLVGIVISVLVRSGKV